MEESGFEMALGKKWGWGKKSQWLCGKKSAKYDQKTNVMEEYVNKNSIWDMVFDVSCHTNLFNIWAAQLLIK